MDVFNDGEKEGIFMKRKNQKTFKLLAMVLSVAFIVGTLTNPAYAYQEKQTSPESGHTALAAASSSLLSASSVRTSIATATVTGIKDKSLDREKNQAETQGVRQRLFS